MRKNSLLFFCLCLLSLTLSGCWSKHKKDGPPPFPVDVSRIPNAVPKIEPLSKLGNKPSYTVFGKRYYVLPTRKNYWAVGIASWYGTLFHKRKTSNGERYNMLGMTAAHRNLPLPTYVQVTNLENGRQVIVKVNDRGPFEPHRLIDLSYVAAKKLGMIHRGTALVKIKAIDPSRPNRRHVYLEIGQFRHKAYAARVQQHLIKLFHHPIYIKSLAHGSQIFYHVQIGPFKDKNAADKIRHRLKALGLATLRMTYDL